MKPLACVLALAGTAASFVGCGDTPTVPDRVLDGPPRFLLVTGINVVAAGQATALQATAWNQGGSTASEYLANRAPIDVTRSARWVVHHETVARMGPAGRVIGNAIGRSDLTVSYETVSYSVPIWIVRPDASLEPFAGTWTGQLVRTCERVIGIGRHEWCTFQGAPVQHRESLSLTLRPEGRLLRGTIQLSGTTIEVQGGVLRDGELILGGAAHATQHVGAEQIHDWRLTLTAAGTLAGVALTDRAYRNIYGVQLDRQHYELQGFVRQ